MSAQLLNEAATILVQINAEPTKIIKAFEDAFELLDDSTSSGPLRIQFLRDFFEWQWRQGRFDAALTNLVEIASVAEKMGDLEWQCRALDQHGVCLQELGRILEARGCHKQALGIAKRLQSPDLTINCLNNLGELARKQGRTGLAIKWFAEAEEIANAHGNVREAVSVAHNRALALQQRGLLAEAKVILEKCRCVSLRQKNWPEFVRALHGLANIAWDQGKQRIALRRFNHALAVAREHNLTERAALLSLNVARILRSQGKSIEGLSVLTAVQANHYGKPDAHLFAMELAELMKEAGETDDSRAHWLIAKEQAIAVGDNSTAFIAAIEAAKSYEKSGHHERAEKCLQEALGLTAEPRDHAFVYAMQVRVLAKEKKQRRLNEVVKRAFAWIKQHNLPEFKIDIYMPGFPR